jgi:O-antigen/teichoic acid export membrane protein
MFTVPFVTRMVSPGELGKSSLFTLTQTLLTFVIFLGLDQSFVRYYNTGVEKKKLLFNSLILPICVCFIVIIGIIIFNNELSFWLFGQYEPLIIFGLCFLLPLIIIYGFAQQLIRMELRGKLYSILSIIFQLTNFLCLFLLLLFIERSFRMIIFATILSYFINTILVILFTKNVLNVRLNNFNKNLVKDLLHFGLPLVPATLLSWVLNSFDKIGLKKWSSFEELGLYTAAFKIVSLLAIVQAVFTSAWTPVAYRWYENKEDNSNFDKVSVVVLAVMVTGFAFIIIFRDIIMLFLGDEYRSVSLIFIYLLFVPVMYTVSETTALGIGFSKKTKFGLYVSIISVVINIIGNYLLIPDFGARGAAISTCISYLVFFWMRTLFSRNLWYKFDIAKYIINIFLLFILVFIIEIKISRIFEIVITGLIIIMNILFLQKYNVFNKLSYASKKN